MSAEDDEDNQEAEKAFIHLYIKVPTGPPLSQILYNPEKRRKLGEFTHVENGHVVQTEHWTLNLTANCLQVKLTCDVL